MSLAQPWPPAPVKKSARRSRAFNISATNSKSPRRASPATACSPAKRLAEADLGQHAGVTVIGQWVGGKLIAPPAPSMRLEAGGILILVGNDASIRNFMNLCAGARQLRRDGPFLIAGGGEVGRKVAELLTDCGEETFMIDTQPGPGVNLVGNVLDTQILKQAGVENVQAVILALSADATTLFSTVIVKDLAPDVPVIARVNRAENVERIYAAGADFALVDQPGVGTTARLATARQRIGGRRPRAAGHQSVHPRLGASSSKQTDLREKTGCTIVAVERGEDLLVEFGAEFKFRSDDAVYVCGSVEATQKFYQQFPQE